MKLRAVTVDAAEKPSIMAPSPSFNVQHVSFKKKQWSSLE